MVRRNRVFWTVSFLLFGAGDKYRSFSVGRKKLTVSGEVYYNSETEDLCL